MDLRPVKDVPDTASDSFLPRTYSESERKHSSEEAGLVLLSSSQDSNPGDVVVENRGGLHHHMAEETRGLHPSMGRLSLRARHASESSLTADMSSPDEGQAEKAGRRAHAKIKSRLKLKNRKKSEATPQFLGRSAALAVPVHSSTRRPERNRVLQEQVEKTPQEGKFLRFPCRQGLFC